jgi:hypothetical protein
MLDTFNNLPQNDISLDQVRELPAVFERVVEGQRSFDLTEAKERLTVLERELEVSEMAIQEYQKSLAEKVIETGQVDDIDQSRGLVLTAHYNELVAEQNALTISLERADRLRKAMGYLARAYESLTSLNDSYISKTNIVGSIDIPVSNTESTTHVVIPKSVLATTQAVKEKPPSEYKPRFGPVEPPAGVRGLKSVK